jgi:hypothetical protein
MVDDNFHYMDESERYSAGEFATLAEALAVAKGIVDEYLTSAYQRGISADDLMASYVMFGEDPFIVTAEVPGVVFSARDYARKRVAEMCSVKKKWW